MLFISLIFYKPCRNPIKKIPIEPFSTKGQPWGPVLLQHCSGVGFALVGVVAAFSLPAPHLLERQGGSSHLGGVTVVHVHMCTSSNGASVCVCVSLGIGLV